jgi:uncharacterized protein
MKVAVATSNYMIGITAAAGAYTYLFRGDVDPRQAAPVVLGVAAGAALGATVGARLRTNALVILFVLVIAYVVFEMGSRALGAS